VPLDDRWCGQQRGERHLLSSLLLRAMTSLSQAPAMNERIELASLPPAPPPGSTPPPAAEKAGEKPAAATKPSSASTKKPVPAKAPAKKPQAKKKK